MGLVIVSNQPESDIRKQDCPIEVKAEENLLVIADEARKASCSGASSLVPAGQLDARMLQEGDRRK